MARVGASEITFLPHFPMNGEQDREKNGEARVGASQEDENVPQEGVEAMKVEQ